MAKAQHSREASKDLQNIPEFDQGYQEFLVNNSGEERKIEIQQDDSFTPRIGQQSYLEQSNVIRISVNTQNSSSAKKS